MIAKKDYFNTLWKNKLQFYFNTWESYEVQEILYDIFEKLDEDDVPELAGKIYDSGYKDGVEDGLHLKDLKI